CTAALYNTSSSYFTFFCTDTATTETYTLSLHDALPISDDERISGSIDSGMPMSAAMSSRHDRVSRSMSMVREAFVTSVTCTPPSTPPVMFHMIGRESGRDTL